jgi:hypothetical protein
MKFERLSAIFEGQMAIKFEDKSRQGKDLMGFDPDLK